MAGEGNPTLEHGGEFDLKALFLLWHCIAFPLNPLRGPGRLHCRFSAENRCPGTVGGAVTLSQSRAKGRKSAVAELSREASMKPEHWSNIY